MNLLSDDVLAEVIVHVMPDFSRKLYVSKLDTKPEVLARIVESVIRAGIDFGAAHGITIQFQTPPPK